VAKGASSERGRERERERQREGKGEREGEKASDKSQQTQTAFLYAKGAIRYIQNAMRAGMKQAMMTVMVALVPIHVQLVKNQR
jgi:hypothetical protein